MPLYLKIAIRYLFSFKSKALSFMSIISILGVIVGVSALLITLAVMSGFMWGLKNKILQNSPHIVVFKVADKFEDYKNIYPVLNKIKDIEDYEPFIYFQALASDRENSVPVIVRGVPADKDKNILGLDKRIVEGKYDLSNGNVIIGKELALSLGLSVGDEIVLISPFGRKTPIGYIPRVKRFKVAGIVDFGFFKYDDSYVGMSLENAQKFFNMKNSITGIQLKVKDPFIADEVKGKLSKYLQFPYIIRTWQEMNKSLFQALQLEKFAMFLVITLIVLVASFNISSLLITKARDKRRDIGILKTMGADSGFILKVFLWQGLIIGFIGTTIGVIIGFLVIYIGDTYHLVKLNPEVYMMEYLPLKTSLRDFVMVYISSIIICFISSIIPAYMSSKEIPAEILRNE